MPLGQLTSVERERLAGFPFEVSRGDLREFFGLRPGDFGFVRRRRGDVNRLGLAVQLGCVRFLGFVPDLERIPQRVVEFVARQLDVPATLAGYGERGQTRSDHLVAVMDHLGFRHLGELEAKRLGEWLVDRAMEHHRPTVLFEQACEWLRSEQLLRPAVSAVERLIAAAAVEADRETFRRLEPVLTSVVLRRLDGLLEVDPRSGLCRLVWVRRGISVVSPRGILDGLDKVDFLRAIGAGSWDVSVLSPNRVRFLARLARTAAPQHLARLPDDRRYPILLAFASNALSDLTDETLDVFCATLGRATARTRRAHREEVLDHTAQIRNDWNRLVRLAELVLEAADHGLDAVDLIGEEIGLDKVRDVARRASESPLGADRFFDHLDRRYAWLRQFTPAVIDAFEFCSRPTDPDLVDAVAVLSELNRTGRRKVPDDAPTGFATRRWQRQIHGDDGSIDRHRWETATIYELRDRLRSGDIWVDGASRYADPEGLMLSEERFVDVRADFHRLTGTAATAASHLDKTRVAIRERAVRLEDRLGDGIDITNGKPALTPLTSDHDPRTESIRSAIGGLLPRVDLADVLIEVDSWCHYTDQLTHATGATPRSVEHQRLLYAAVLAQACNLGISAMGEISDVTSRQLAWTTDWYLRDDTLRSAVAQIVKHHHGLPGARVWGSGIMSSSDGQRFPVPVRSINATALPRYFNRGRGVEMYTWTSDQYSQYGSKIVPATVRDATHVLDELLDNEADLPIVEHTTDTAGYTDLIFGLFDLLGLTFSPRLRNIANQRLYRLEPIPDAPTVATLLRHRINTDLIIRHWDDMIRTAASLKSGDVTASLLVSRLQAGARRNQLTRAIQELGRAAKTRFLLAYLEDQSYRRRIGRQLNKGETLHALRRFIFFANEAQIRHRRPEDQTNQALCLNLVTNAVICWNTVYIAAAIDLLRNDGTISADDDLSRISPALRDHINPYGRYTFDLEQPTSTLRPLHNTEHTYDA